MFKVQVRGEAKIDFVMKAFDVSTHDWWEWLIKRRTAMNDSLKIISDDNDPVGQCGPQQCFWSCQPFKSSLCSDKRVNQLIFLTWKKQGSQWTELAWWREFSGVKELPWLRELAVQMEFPPSPPQQILGDFCPMPCRCLLATN